MECDKVRDRFSSLLERGLNPSEEKIVREHLSTCAECQREYEQFDRTIQWLHSVGEEEVLEGFLPGIYKKMDDRKSKAPMAEKVRLKWFHYPLSFKIPIQAVGMLTLVILVLYITKMMPVETPRLKEVGQPKASLSGEKKTEGTGISKDMKKEGIVSKPSLEASRVKDVEKTKGLVPREERTEDPLISPLPSSDPEKNEKGWMAKGSASPPAKPPQEIVLRISDREKVLSQLHKLIKQFGGEMVTAEGNTLLASLPVDSFTEFEKELIGISSFAKEDKMVRERNAAQSLEDTAEVMSKKIQEKGKESAKSKGDRSRTIAVRIILLQE